MTDQSVDTPRRYDPEIESTTEKSTRRQFIGAMSGLYILSISDRFSEWLDGLFADDAVETTTTSVTENGLQITAPTVYEFGAGISDAEIARYPLGANQSFELTELSVRLQGGGTDTNLSVDVIDASTGELLAGTSDVVRGDPVGTSSEGSEIVVRASNSGSTILNAGVASLGRVV